MIPIIAVGHTKCKMDNLLSLVSPDIIIFNGIKEYPDSIHVSNNSGRDIYMYARGFEILGCDYAFCINDDTKHISKHLLISLEEYTSYDISGVPNLSSWVDYKKCDEQSLQHAKKQGRIVRFIRTSGFFISRRYFNTIYSKHKNAQDFEKNTLRYTKNFKLIKPRVLIDSNIKRYI